MQASAPALWYLAARGRLRTQVHRSGAPAPAGSHHRGSDASRAVEAAAAAAAAAAASAAAAVAAVAETAAAWAEIAETLQRVGSFSSSVCPNAGSPRWRSRSFSDHSEGRRLLRCATTGRGTPLIHARVAR